MVVGPVVGLLESNPARLVLWVIDVTVGPGHISFGRTSPW